MVLKRDDAAVVRALGGVDGILRAVSSNFSTAGGAEKATQSQPQKITVVVRAEPREMAHAITPYIEDEQKRTDTWE